LLLAGQEPHHFSQCPANIFTLPDEKSVFDCIIGIQDAYNEVLSSEVDDFSAFCDAYLALCGVDADDDDIKAMKENRVMILPPNTTANYITKNANDTQVENILKRLHESAYRIAQCPDFSSDSFNGGVSSGISIRYKLTGMENRAGSIEAEMKKALQRRIELICGIAEIMLGEEVYRDIQIEFKRNIPADINEIINMVNALKGSVSDKTLLSLLPFIDDADAELEAVKAQRQANLSLYSFSTGMDEEEDAE
jgi:SPP1 family phage portal protein